MAKMGACRLCRILSSPHPRLLLLLAPREQEVGRRGAALLQSSSPKLEEGFKVRANVPLSPKTRKAPAALLVRANALQHVSTGI